MLYLNSCAILHNYCNPEQVSTVSTSSNMPPKRIQAKRNASAASKSRSESTKTNPNPNTAAKKSARTKKATTATQSRLTQREAPSRTQPYRKTRAQTRLAQESGREDDDEGQVEHREDPNEQEVVPPARVEGRHEDHIIDPTAGNERQAAGQQSPAQPDEEWSDNEQVGRSELPTNKGKRPQQDDDEGEVQTSGAKRAAKKPRREGVADRQASVESDGSNADGWPDVEILADAQTEINCMYEEREAILRVQLQVYKDPDNFQSRLGYRARLILLRELEDEAGEVVWSNAEQIGYIHTW